jgi:DNA-binding transcriptional LysR family regulator
MTDLRVTKLRRLDLTTLLVFDGVMRLKKATLAAAELGLTPPGISHALKRLRDVFGDELFIRRPHGLEPTAFALSAAPRIRRAIGELRDSLSEPEAFDPSTADITLRIGAFDYELATLVPAMMGDFARQAPRLKMVLRPIGRASALQALTDGSLDMAVGYFWNAPDTMIATRLYTETYAVVARTSDGLAARGLSLDHYCASPHLLVSPAGDLHGIVDAALARIGRSRQVIASLPLFLPALAAVQATGALATIPRRLAERFAASFELDVLPPPLDVRSFDVSAVRHRREARSALHVWVTQALIAAAVEA